MKLTRRQMLAGTAGLAASTAFGQSETDNRTWLKPKALKPGDRVAIIAPAGAADNQEHINKACDKVRGLGFEPVPSHNILRRYGYLAGTDQQRADDLNAAFQDDAIKGIFCLRGGYGTTRMLHLLDYENIRKNPKVVIGFSDITGIHCAIAKHAKVHTFHGPCAESSWNEFQQKSLPVLTQNKAYGECLVQDEDVRATVHHGTAEGRIICGNLTLFSCIMGTPDMPDTRGSILVLEDVGEAPYRVDRMLTQLLNAGVIQECAGIVLGNFSLPKPNPDDIPPEPTHTFTMDEVIADRMAGAGVPCFKGFAFGHVAQQQILPIGVRAQMDANACTLSLLESAVR